MANLHARLLARITEDSDGCEGTSAQVLVDALRAAVELHEPLNLDVFVACAAEVRRCDSHTTYTLWPCSTIAAIAEHLGVEATDG